MSIRLIQASSKTELSDDFHLPRIIILLNEADSRASKTVEGIMKLAKLDFLLRYPNCLERLLNALNKKTQKIDIKPYERTSIESKMVRFRYGPWDDRYRKWIGILVAKGLAITFLDGRTVHVGITDAGRQVAEELLNMPEFADYKIRAKVIFTSVGSKSATSLKDLIYKVFPEIINMKWGKGIEL